MNLNQQEYYIEQMIVSLRTRLLVMGASVEIAVDNMHKAVKELNVGTAQAVIENDDDIDDLENEIDESSLTLLAKSQPVAKDLRFVISCLRMVTDMERIGDEAAAICSQVILMDGADKNQVLGLLGRHLEAATTAFANAMNIVRDMDATKAREMNEHTDDDAVQSEVAVMDTLMRRLDKNSEDHIDPLLAMHLILMTHSLTRIWRRSANMVGHVCFACMGQSVKHANKKSKQDKHIATDFPDSLPGKTKSPSLKARAFCMGRKEKLYFTRLYFCRVATSFARCSAERGKSGRRISSSTLPMSARAVFTGMGLVTENMEWCRAKSAWCCLRASARSPLSKAFHMEAMALGAMLEVTEMMPQPPSAQRGKAVKSSPERTQKSSGQAAMTSAPWIMLPVASLMPAKLENSLASLPTTGGSILQPVRPGTL